MPIDTIAFDRADDLRRLPPSTMPIELLATAVMRADRQALEQALSMGVNVNARLPNTGGYAALPFAIYRHSKHNPSRDLIPRLLEAGADPGLNAPETAFHAAARAADSTVLKRLIKVCPAGVNARNAQGATPLQAGLFHPVKPVNYRADLPVWVRVLLDNGADVNAHDERNEAVYPYLLGRRSTVPIRPTNWKAWLPALLAAGLDPLIPNRLGIPALHAGIRGENWLTFTRMIWEARPLLSMDVQSPDGRTAWDMVPSSERVSYDLAWRKHEQTYLQALVQGLPPTETEHGEAEVSRPRL